jgi:phosphatidylglycerol---prolipoprotein diacylglyceryl transferase
LFIENISPVIFTLGPLVFRWYGLMMVISFMVGGYYFIKNGVREGLDEERLLALLIIIILGGILGARALYVLTNLPAYINTHLKRYA